MALFVFLYIHISFWFNFHFNLWIGQVLSLKSYEQFKTQKAADLVSVWAHVQEGLSLPWDPFLLPRGASQLRLSVRPSSPCCSHYRLRTSSSRGPLRPGRGLMAGQSLPCEGMRYFGSLHFHCQQTGGRFLFLTHWKNKTRLTLLYCIQFSY